MVMGEIRVLEKRGGQARRVGGGGVRALCLGGPARLHRRQRFVREASAAPGEPFAQGN